VGAKLRSYFAILSQSYEKSRAKQKNLFFFCRDGVISPSKTAKLRKKSVTKDGIWRINAEKADFVSGMITACYVVFDGEAVVVNASVQTRQEIMSAIEMLNPGSSSY
jgi:hypothetical protein